MPKHYVQRYDGEWVDVTFGRAVACCDCGLVHDEEFAIIDNTDGTRSIITKATRNVRHTAYRRMSIKPRKGKGEKK